MQSVAVLALISAVFNCVAMIAMKSCWTIPSIGLALVIGLALLAGGAFEVAALKQERLGLIYVGILGAEVVIIGSVSLLHFDEVFSLREVAGITLVLIGTAVAWT